MSHAYKHKVEQIEQLDDEVVDAVTSALAAEAANKFTIAIGWMVGRGDARVNIKARAAAIGYLSGDFTLRKAAEVGGVQPSTMHKLKTDLLKNLGLVQSMNKPIRNKE